MQNRVIRLGCGRSCAGLVAAAGLVLGVLAPASAQVEWRTGQGQLMPAMTRAELGQVVQGMQLAAGSRHMLVRLSETPDKATRQALAAEGIELQRWVGDGSWFARVDAGVFNPNAPFTSATVQRIDPIQRQWKLHEDLAAGIVHPWTVVRQELVDIKPDNQMTVVEREKQAAVQTIVAVYVQFHTDVDLVNEATRIARRHGGWVRSSLETVNGLVVEMPWASVNALADEDAVSWVEPPLPALQEVNAENRARTGADIVNMAPYNLDGSGVNVLVYDGGKVLTTHADFSGRATVGMSDTSGTSDHSTHVAGTIGGDGTLTFNNRGMAPGVTITSYGFEQEGGLSEGFLYTDPGDFEDDYTEAITFYGADIANNSIGTNTAPNGFPCEWEGNYGLMGSLIDGMVRGDTTGSPFRIVWANGNERQGSARCGSTYLTTAPPACAKNHITVGALNSNDDSVTSFTSWGPSDDGRMKPDISAPGCQSDGDGGVTSTSSSGGYNVKCGTSMASPTVCGLGALMLQDYRNLYPGEPDFRNSTLKAILANTAVDLVNPGPDFQTGYGSVRIQPAIDLLRAGNFAEGEVDHGGTAGVVVVVDPGTSELKITIAWDDAPGTPNVNPVLVNDLDLVVTSPSGTRFYPWTLDAGNPANDAVRTAENHVDNLEQVFVPTPEAGGWSVEIRGFNVPTGPQSFSIASSSFLVNCSSSGIASLDSSEYACEDMATLKVVDCDLNTSDAIVDTVDVHFYSDTDPVGYMVTLTESAPESAAFLGSVALSASGAPGALAVSNGDTITMTYIDADDGNGGTNISVTDLGVIDCDPPVISNVMVMDVDARNATITFDTDEAATPIIHYGTSCGMLDQMVTGAALRTTHAVTLTGLDDNTGYFFSIEASDAAGNTASDDDGGSCYAFMTPEVPDFFTEQFGGGLDIDNMTMTFVPNGSVDFYEACIEPIAGLPTDPTGGTVITMSDDDSELVTLTGGASISIYGNSYSSFYVGSNGYVTFSTSDTDYSETYEDHFDTERVSALFDDLNPSAGGTVSWKQLGDRVAVTWSGVPQYSTSDSNTFQIELFFDGTVTISWNGIASGDAICGLSGGGGLSPDFFATDLSGVGNCGPRPPVAAGASYSTPVATSVSMELMATDDGLPAPPSVSLWVDSLPANGLLVDLGSGSVISSVPHALSGTMVKYAPTGLYQGTDSFTFFGDDGGTPPDGGSGNSATISLTIGGPQSAAEFLTDDTDPGWTTEGQWAFGTPTGGGSHALDPTGGFTGSNVYGYNLAGDYPNNMPRYNLTSGAIDLSNVSGCVLTFYRWLGVESATYDHADVDISTNGTTWTNIWTHTGSAVSESNWFLQTYDISAIADNQATVYLRWGMGTSDGSVTYPGWNIDDIIISGLQPVPPCPGDANLDGTVDFDDLNIVL
ncbi:MAG: S8 family serine peptidase, partial [Phycisphaerales bacterium]|nr:S8 family serine peptidase [Phycisphaerales bacterium]